ASTPTSATPAERAAAATSRAAWRPSPTGIDASTSVQPLRRAGQLPDEGEPLPPTAPPGAAGGRTLPCSRAPRTENQVERRFRSAWNVWPETLTPPPFQATQTEATRPAGSSFSASDSIART